MFNKNLLKSIKGELAFLANIKKIVDERGGLTAAEYPTEIPFLPKRYFLISGVSSMAIRGEHAHKKCGQFLVCLQGSCKVTLNNGHESVNVVLSSQEQGLYLPSMIWGIQSDYSADAILLVLASDIYDTEDYIRNYEEFLSIV